MKEQLLKLIESIDTDKVLTGDQRTSLEQFGESIVTKMNEERESGYNDGFAKSKSIAESYMSEYEDETDKSLKSLFESVDTLIEKRELLAVKENSNNDEIVTSLSDYIDTYIQESMPESVVVDYKKLQRLEKMSEGVKELFLISDEMVQEKTEEVIKQVSESSVEIQSNLDLKTKQLQEEMEKRISIQQELSKIKSSQLLEEKLKDIPELESNKLRKQFTGSSVEEINESFDTTYDNIKYGIINEKEYVDVSDKIKSIVAEVEIVEDVKEDVEDIIESSSIASYATYVNKLEK